MLQSSKGRSSLCCNWSTPFKAIEIEDEEIIEPELSVSTSEDKHLVVDDARGVKLTHWCLSTDDSWYVKTEFIDPFFQVDEYHIRQYLETVPAAIYNYLTPIPHLTGVPHPRLWQLMLINFWL